MPPARRMFPTPSILISRPGEQSGKVATGGIVAGRSAEAGGDQQAARDEEVEVGGGEAVGLAGEGVGVRRGEPAESGNASVRDHPLQGGDIASALPPTSAAGDGLSEEGAVRSEG